MDVDEASETANGGSETTTENGDDPMEDVLPTENQLDRTGTPPLGASASRALGAVGLAPALLHLADEYKFRDANQEVLHIETRGRQTYEDILFLASDVSMKMPLGGPTDPQLSGSNPSTAGVGLPALA
ncbi:hypothetical protein HDU86_000618 [Geranomyces michiganensis]|nr:hypothetical protein HDU86_000618 [Geranomyces michiganensis]